MSGTLKVVTRKKRPELTAEEKLVEELVAWAREQGLLLIGPDGLLRQLTKTVLETALRTRHLTRVGVIARDRGQHGDVTRSHAARAAMAPARHRPD